MRALKLRIASSEADHLLRCSVPDPQTGAGCGRPTTRGTRGGLSKFLCRYHQQHLQRHGSTWRKSPRAALLRPYLTAAFSYLDTHQADPFVKAAIEGLIELMRSAGPVEIATRLAGLLPADRARIAMARLREADIRPERILAIPLAVGALMEEAPAIVHRTREWRIVAIAKAAHRLASGTHRVWSLPQSDGSTRKIEMHAYPRSSGRVLRHLGERIEKECEWVVERHLAKVLALKLARYGKHESA
jgi:hypothetical protein